MKNIYLNELLIFLSGLILIGCKSENKPEILFQLTNPLPVERSDELIVLPVKELSEYLNEEEIGNIKLDIPYQTEDVDNDGEIDQFLILSDFKPNESVQFTKNSFFSESSNVFPRRTQAEISHKINGHWEGREYMEGEFKNVEKLDVPPEHTDHSWYIRYEGPGWESDKVGYRFYLDWRNATDIFGKKTEEMVLQNVGMDGFDSYHEEADWGMDILKVGNSLGIGSIGTWVENKAERVAKTDSLKCKILSNGIIQSKIETKYFGWEINNTKTDLTSVLTINAGKRLTHCELSMTNALPNICTGIVKLENTELIQGKPNEENGWSFLATYGTQTLNNDDLGMVIFYKNEDLVLISEDNDSHVIVLKSDGLKVDYYFAAAWEKEPNGIKNVDEFKNYLATTVDLLNNPILIEK